MANRIFTKKELKELGTKAVDQLKTAIDSGDKEKAQKLARYMYSTFFSMHDLYVDWVTYLLTFIYDNYGDEALRKALDKSYRPKITEACKLFQEQTDMRRKVALSVGTLQGHLENVKITEDDEKFTFEVNPCGSGQRLLRRGGYKSPMKMAKVKNAQLMTFDTKNFPIYCTHCGLNDLYAIEEMGRPWMVVETPKDWEKDPCRAYLYKDTTDIPEKWYKRAGKKKTPAKTKAKAKVASKTQSKKVK